MKLVTCMQASMHTIEHIYTLSHNMMDNGISFMNSTMQRSNIRFSCVPFTIASVVPQYGLSELREGGTIDLCDRLFSLLGSFPCETV